MENCKFCNQELPEGCTFCPHCGKPLNEPEAVEAPAEETASVEAPAEETAPVEAAPEVPAKKATPGKIALAVGAAVVLLAVLVALIVAGVKGKAPAESAETPQATEETVPATVPEDGNPDDVTCKGSYTVTDEASQSARSTVVATVGDRQLTNGQLQVYYWSAVNSFLSSQQGYYVMMYGGIDYTKPLDTQRCVADEKLTWQQYFLDQALGTWQTSCALAAEAEKAGLEISPEEKEFLDNMESYLADTAASNNMTVEELMLHNVGPGAGVDEFTGYQELFSRGRGYYAQETAKLVPTDADLEAYFESNAETFASEGIDKDSKFVNVRHILVMPKAEGEEATEEEWAACEQDAQAILDAWLAGDKTEDSFAALANEKSEDPGSNTNGGLYENVVKGQMVEPFENWCFDETRKTGDTGLVKTSYGYHIMYYVSNAEQWKYYAKNDWVIEQTNQLILDLAERYPMEADYSQMALGFMELGK